MKKVPGDLIALTLVSQVAEFTAMIFSGWFYPKLGPYMSMLSTTALSAVGSVLLMMFWTSNSPKLILTFVILEKLGMTAAFNAVFIAWATIMPTKLNATAFGYVNIIARVFNSLSSLIAEAEYHVSISYNIICCLASGLAACFLVTKQPRYI